MPLYTTLACHLPTSPAPADDIRLQCNATAGTARPDELIAFSHAALFSPVLSTLEYALRSNFIIHFPGLTVPLLRKYPPKSLATAKGHLDQIRKNIRSTKPKPKKPRKPEAKEAAKPAPAASD